MKRSMIIRQLMINKDMKVSDISKQSGIAYSTVKSILENGTGKASYINICKICSSLGITPDELEHIAKENTIHESQLTKKDFELLEKYRSLDTHGQQTVDIILDRELKRTTKLRQSRERIAELESQSAPIISLRESPEEHIGDAAHSRTDIKITDEMRTHDDDIMDDENF